jgi:hypothetical protein
MFYVVRQQRQLVQRLLKLRSRFRHRREGGGPMTGLAPTGDGLVDESSLGHCIERGVGMQLDLRSVGDDAEEDRLWSTEKPAT